MKDRGYKLIIAFLLLIIGILVVLLFIGDSGKYCTPVVKEPQYTVPPAQPKR